MVYSFGEDIFDNSDATINTIDKIFINSIDRHELYISNIRTFEIIKESEWYVGLRKSSKLLIDESFESSIYHKKQNVNVEISNQANCYSLKEAEEILTKTVNVILEHIEYDQFFINSLLKNFKSESSKIIKHQKNGWLSFVNGGGNNITNVLNDMKKRYIYPEFPKHCSHYLRCIVILDSDKKFPSNQEVSVEKKKFLDDIKAIVGTSYHVTFKREMENYLPDEALNLIKDSKEYIEAYLTLNEIQKDYFDIENGLSNKNIEQLQPDELRDLFLDLKNPELKILKNQSLIFKNELGKKISFKATFPKYFETKEVTKASLKKRANSDELETLLTKINTLL